MYKDFLHKRHAIFNKLVRDMSSKCVRVCTSFELPANVNPDEVEPNFNVDKFSMEEEACLARCEHRVVKMHAAIERHLDDTFNPAFLTKFL